MQTKYPFGTFGPDHLRKMKTGIECFNAGKFWECHEALEDVWLEDRNDPARNVYWAVIQVANALFHIENKNITGARGQLNKSKEKFNRCVDQKIETRLTQNYLNWEELKSLVFAIDSESPKLEDFKKLQLFKFRDYPC